MLQGHRPAKVIMLGDSSVGKTSIVVQFCKGEFDPANEATVGASYIAKVMSTEYGNLPLHVWDTAGQERFKSVIPMYMRGCAAVVLVCSTDSFESVKHLDNWLAIITETVSDLENICVVLNKIDKEPAFDPATAEEWADAHHCKFYRCTATDRTTVDPVFQDIATAIAKVTQQGIQANQIAVNGKAEKNSSCCK